MWRESVVVDASDFVPWNLRRLILADVNGQ